MKSIAIILPCYNESALIRKMKQLVEQHISDLQYNFEIVFVNDGSLDATSDIIKTFNSSHKNINITLLDLYYNMGHQSAIYQGLLYTNDKKFDNILIMDSDGEDDPAAIVEILKHNEFELVQVVRAKRNEKLFFRLSYTLYKQIFKLLIGKKLNFGNFSLIKPKLVKALVEKNFIHLAATLNNQRCHKHQISWDRAKRLDGESKMNFTSLFYHAINSLVENAQDLLFFFIKLSATILIAILLMVGIIIYKKFWSLAAIPGWSSSLILSLCNSLLICIGIFITGALQLNILYKQKSAKRDKQFDETSIIKNWTVYKSDS
ncbi:glycosyltransferase [Carboxylicivirga sp. M1479]|uniref:glycosyltransferase n=1 Tax=Carboxylicivirga sp. M1479 TaxID=2594476 RepID=UPI0011787DA5|nr:glycosyltransferase [Carboxylicivirga sp. M1479]TRX66228.1 glycosyltransferase [Carboxylicivirga sp. M1479]